jgi:glutamine amidotransferase/cyclase
MVVTLLDYGAGNVRSVRNALRELGHTVENVKTAEDIITAEKLIFPGVGSFGLVMNRLQEGGYIEPLQRRIKENKPFLGICVAMQALFEGSEESPGIPGLGIIAGQVARFPETNLSVPQIGWNNIRLYKNSRLFNGYKNEKLYFVHSYHAPNSEATKDWILSVTDYGDEFVSAVEKGNISAFQFHPEKSGKAGLRILNNFLSSGDDDAVIEVRQDKVDKKTNIAKRIIACLDVRSNDTGDLVVTKGDQYDVRSEGEVRNLGKPVELAKRYYEEGADEITFLNITGFRDFPMQDQPMIEVLERTSENVFVPLTIGGGIREFTDSDGVSYTSLDVASAYFRSGADKVSIGSDAVYAVEEYLKNGNKKSGKSSIEQISIVYGAQAVVISVDPRRVYVQHPEDTDHTTIRTTTPGPGGEHYCWYQCTVKGGREGRDIDVVQLVKICEKLGAGEILLNCIDKDGTNSGFDLELVNLVKTNISIPVIASSGAGNASHFVDVFEHTTTDAALAAGIFHRKEVSIGEVKMAVRAAGIEIR